MVPVTATEKVKVTPDKEIEITDKESKISHIKKSVPFHNLEQWAHDMRKNHAKINRMKAKNEYFAFKIEGHRSYQAFSTISELISYLQNYGAFEASRKNQRGFFEALEIIRIPDASKWARAVTRKRMLTPAKRSAQSKRERANWQRRFRASLSPAQKEKYKRAAKKRAKESRQRRRR